MPPRVNIFEGVSTEAKQDVLVTALADLLAELQSKIDEGGTVALDAATLAALEDITTTTTIAGTVSVDDADLRGRIGEVGPSPTANTVLARLKDLYDAVDGLEGGEEATVSSNNSTTTPLSGGATFTGTADDLLGYAQVNVAVEADVDGATDGMTFEFSHDGVSWFTSMVPAFTYEAPGARRFQFGVYARYFRVVYENGGSAQSSFVVQTLLLPVESLESIHRLGGDEDPDRSVLLTKAGLTAKSVIGSFINVPAGGLHADSFSQDNIVDGGTLTTDYMDTAGQSSALVFLLADQNVDVTVRWSPDGAAGRGGLVETSTITPVETSGFFVYLDVLTTMVDRYVRLEVANNSGSDTTSFESDVWLYDKPFTGSYGGLNDTLSSLSSALLARSVLAGEAPDDTFDNVGITRAGLGQFAMLTRDVGLDGNRTLFGALNTETMIPDVTVDFANDVLNLITETTANGGTASLADAQSVLSTSTDAAGSAERRTRIPVRYRPGSELRFDFTAVFTTGVANSEQHIGAMAEDDQDGVYLGYDGATFGVTHRQDGSDTVIAQSSWNGDPLDGSSTSRFTSNGAPVTWDPTTGNVYRIRFGWLGYSVIIFEVQSPDGEYVRLHTVQYPNTATVPHLYQNDLQIWSHVANTGNTTDLSLMTASWRGGSMTHARPQARVIFQRTDSLDGTLPSGGTPTIDSVLNTDSNVFDSGWLPTFDFPGGNFINIVGDQTLDVYLLNASSAAGANMVGDSAPAIETAASTPATFVAPFFDDFYRIIVVNNSGSNLTDYTIHNRGHEAAQQNLNLNLDQTLLSFFTAQLTRSILSAKNDSGTWGNITRADDGGLRTAITEHEVETPLKALQTFDTNQSNIPSSSAVQIVGSPLADRKTVLVKNLSDSSKTIFIGTSSAVTSSDGYELAAGEGVELDLDPTGTGIWAIAASGTMRACWLEIGGT